MMSRLKLIASEAVRSLGANLSTTFAATTTVLIGMFMLGLVVGLGSWALSLSDHYQKQLLVNVFFCTDPARPPCKTAASVDQIGSVHNQLISMPEVKSVVFVSKEDALRRMQKEQPALTRGLTSNPFPPKFVVRPRDARQIDTIVSQIANLNNVGVESTCPPAAGSAAATTSIGRQCGHITHRVVSVARYLWIFVLIAFAVLLISSTLLVANTIRLSIFARRREIEVMKLVGATNWFVRGPFMIEGLLCGLAGAIAAIILLFLGRSIFLGHVVHLHEQNIHAWPFPFHVLIILGAGLLLGAMGSGLTIRRFLQV
jgi:cell division transport system permease protein